MKQLSGKKTFLAAGLIGTLVLLSGCVYVPVESPQNRQPPPPSLPGPAAIPPVPPPPPPVVTREPAPSLVEPPTPARPAPSEEVIWAVQIHLDRENCSPGGIDGRWGPKTAKALAAWQIKHDQPPSGHLDEKTLAILGQTNGLFTTYTITAADHENRRPWPSSWLQRAEMDALNHETIEEMIGEKFHVAPAALRRLNPGLPWPDPPAGTVITVPQVHASPLPPLSRLEIRLEERTLRAFDRHGKLAAHFPCSIAADPDKRPAGETLRVVVWAENPDYTFDPTLFSEDPEAAAIGRRLRIPPGPNNPVGRVWIGLDRPGYGIHGSPLPEEISKTESHGCFRLTNWDALKLLRAIRKDLPVVVLP